MTTAERNKMTDAELRDMNRQGWSPAELAIHFACSAGTVERRLARLGLDRQPGRVMTGGKGGGR
jgi:metal-dependent amidase/aminoacylase/carboxypeptidase family protein